MAQVSLQAGPRPRRRFNQLKREALKDERVQCVGVTTTADGRWALVVWLREGETGPLADLEKCSGEVPIVYERELETMVARPAYPKEDE